MRMQVKLEIGHKAACRLEPTPEGFTHDWTIFVRGSEGKDISHFVEKVIFHLHESFPKPKRAIKDPPYKLDESGYGSFELKIEVCFKTKDEPRRVHFTYDLFLPLSGLPPVTSVRTEALTFTHPTEDFMRKLVKGGGMPISNVNGTLSNGVSNGHPAPREETKEPVSKSNPNINDNEKSKKVKISKSSAKPSSAVVGMKRSPPSHEQTIADGVPKKKKKSEGSSSKSKHSQGETVKTPASQPLKTEVKDLKVKFKPVLPKDGSEKDKKREPSTDGHHKTKTSKGKESKSHKSEPSESKKLDSSEHKVKVKKKLEKGEKSEKKKSGEKKDKSKSKKDKKLIEKVTIRRSSGDSWANAGGLMSNVVAKNKALGKLLSEMSSDEDEGDLPTPFKHEPSPVSKNTHKEKGDLPTPFKHEPPPTVTKPAHREKGDSLTTLNHESSSSLPKNAFKEQSSHKEHSSHKEQSSHKEHSSHKEQNAHKEHSSHKEQSTHKEHSIRKEQSSHKEQNSHKEQSAHKEHSIHKEHGIHKQMLNKNGVNNSKSIENSGHISSENTSQVENNTEEVFESNEPVQTPSAVENGIFEDVKVGNNRVSKRELYDLYEQITKCEDSEFLQKIVDVIETTGHYTVAEKTFEFDLCSLEKTTLQKLQNCLGKG